MCLYLNDKIGCYDDDCPEGVLIRDPDILPMTEVEVINRTSLCINLRPTRTLCLSVCLLDILDCVILFRSMISCLKRSFATSISSIIDLVVLALSSAGVI